MKLAKIALLAVAVVGLAAATGCSTMPYGGNSPSIGILFEDTQAPAQSLAVAVDPTAKPTKEGTANGYTILGLVSIGDSSLHHAMEKGGITKVHHVDHKVTSVLSFIYREWTVKVYGE